MLGHSTTSQLLLSFPIPLLNPSSPFLAPFPHRTMPSSTTISIPIPISVSIIPVPTSTTSSISTIIPLPFALFIIPIPLMARWAQAPAPAPAPANPIPAIPAEKPPPQLPPNQFHMHEITIPAAVTAILLKLPARGLAKIGDRREISDDRTAGVESALQSSQGGGRLVLLAELDVDVADHVVGEVVADMERFDLAEF